MNTSEPRPEMDTTRAESGTGASEIQRQLERILSSRLFRSAQTQRKFIRFVVEETLGGRASGLKEVIIGVEAFGRGDSFDPRLDPIVRTEARKLRVRLTRYYETEGRGDPLQIELPKGAYVPVFRTHPPLDAATADFGTEIGRDAPVEIAMQAESTAAPVSSAEAQVAAAPDPSIVQTPWKTIAIVLAVLTIAGSGSTVLYLLASGSSAPTPSVLQASATPAVDPAAGSEAYRSYLRGKHHWNKLTADGLRRAIEHFEKAIVEDASFARAYVALADSYIMAPQVNGVPSPQVVARIRTLATKALELDSTLGEAHIDLAICAQYEFDWRTAQKEFNRGLELSPNSVTGHLWYAKFLALMGKHREVMEHRSIAARIDPVSPYAIQALGGYLSVMGRYDEAIEQFNAALTLEPGFGLARQGLGIAYVLKGLPERGITELRAACIMFGGPRREALLGFAYGVSGRTAEARAILASFRERPSGSRVPALAMAQVYIGLGEKDQAFQWLEKAIDERDLSVTLQWDSIYASLRTDPRYFRLLQRMKLA